MVVPTWFWWTSGTLIVSMISGVWWFIWWSNKRDWHIVLMDDKRFKVIRKINEPFISSFTFGENEWQFVRKYNYMNERGRTLTFYTPKANTNLDVDAKGIVSPIDPKITMKLMNESHIKLLTKKPDSFKDTLTLFGAIGGIIAGIGALVLLAHDLGLFNQK